MAKRMGDTGKTGKQQPSFVRSMIAINAGDTPGYQRSLRQGAPWGEPPQIQVRIAQIDNFNPITAEEAAYPQDIHFNHGETVANMLRAGGADPSLSGWVSVQPFNVGSPEDQSLDKVDAWVARIAAALEQIIAQAKRQPDSIDAVCISLQNPYETPESAIVRQYIDTLTALGVPVVVAAGNRSSNPNAPVNFAPNYLACNAAFVVQATQHGNLLHDSKRGNISAEGRSTSFAVPSAAPLAGSCKARGCNIEEIRTLIQQRVEFHHGTLPAAIAPNAYTDTATVALTEAAGATAPIA